MLYDFVKESALLESVELLEDKMVKFGGEVSPKFGWCIIYMGGGASGKSTATKYLSGIQGKVFNVDDWKENPNRWKLTDPSTGRSYEDGFTTPVEDRTLDNDEFTHELHTTFKNSTKKVKAGMLNNKGIVDPSRLPNIIFDMTGDELRKIDEIVSTVKPQGYKVGIIWILNAFAKAQQNIAKRDRKGAPDLVHAKHRDVLKTAEEIFETGYINNIDEFWVIDAFSPEGIKRDENGKIIPDSVIKYHDEPNVYHIPTNKKGLEEFEQVVNLIETTREQIKNYK